MSEPASAAATAGAAPIPTIDPLELHRYLLRVHQLDMGLRLRLVEGLLAMEEGELYLLLGCSSTLQYAHRYFGLKKSAGYKALETARALRGLPRTREAFLHGFPYSRVALVCAVATAETEEEWLALAKDSSVKTLEREVQEAKAKNRKRPRKEQYGLPSVRTRLPFDFAPEEYELLGNALKKVQKELSGSLGGKEVDPKAALLFLAQLALKSDPGTLEGRVESDQSIYRLLYHRCLDCHRSFLLTEEGAVDVPPEVVDAIEPSARKETIAPEEEVPPGKTPGESAGAAPPAPARDKPNSPRFRRRLLLRDGCVCSNPMCGRRLHLQGHHLLGRAKGGRTAFYNETAVCPTCHSLIELGYLKVKGDPIRGLAWNPRARAIGGPAGVPDVRKTFHTRGNRERGEATAGGPSSGSLARSRVRAPASWRSTDSRFERSQPVAPALESWREAGRSPAGARDGGLRARPPDARGHQGRSHPLRPAGLRPAAGGREGDRDRGPPQARLPVLSPGRRWTGRVSRRVENLSTRVESANGLGSRPAARPRS